MVDEFVVTPKRIVKKEAKTVIMTLRLERKLQEKFDQLAQLSDRTRNELMCMALRFAVEQAEFAGGEPENDCIETDEKQESSYGK